MSEVKPRHCPFCGALVDWDGDVLTSINEKHINGCRIRRFNQACDAALVGLLSYDSDDSGPMKFDDWVKNTVASSTAYARALVEAIEKEAHEQK